VAGNYLTLTRPNVHFLDALLKIMSNVIERSNDGKRKFHYLELERFCRSVKSQRKTAKELQFRPVCHTRTCRPTYDARSRRDGRASPQLWRRVGHAELCRNWRPDERPQVRPELYAARVHGPSMHNAAANMCTCEQFRTSLLTRRHSDV